MHYNIYENGGAVEGYVTVSGMVVTDFIRLKGDPVERLEAASKQYVDLIASTVKSLGVVSGSFNKDILPGFSGQVFSIAGNNVLTLSTVDIPPNTYAKITVGPNGFVNGGSNLTYDDIPSLSWSKINTGRPTTLVGYGIVDGVNSIAGQITGALTANSSPVDGKDLATKGYTDTKPLNAKTYSVGDLIVGGYFIPPTGFLRCNGGEVSKTTYAALYSVVGDAYATSTEAGLGLQGYGKPWTMQNLINNVQSGDLTDYTQHSDLPQGQSYGNVVVTKNRVYLFPGLVNGVLTSNFYTTTINPDGTIEPTSSAGQTPHLTDGAAILAIKDKVYIIGGSVDQANPLTDKVAIANINPDGTLGSWNVGNPLPISIGRSDAFYVHGKIFVFVGWDNLGGNVGSSAKVIVGTPSADGSSVAWGAPITLGVPNMTSGMFAMGTKVYAVTNYDGGEPAVEIWESSLSADGTLSHFNTVATYPGSSYGKPVVTNGSLYLLNYFSPVSSPFTAARISISGETFGELTKFSGITEQRDEFASFVTSSKLYVLGGTKMVDGNVVSVVKVASYSFSGGTNNYSIYYNEVAGSAGDPTKFRLPDYTSSAEPNGKVFVRY